MATLEFFFDYTSPYSYLAATQVEALAARTGATLVWKPIFLGGVFKLTGNRAPAELMPKGMWMMKDLTLWQRRYGLKVTFPSRFPMNTLLALRVALAVEPSGKLPAYSIALFQAYHRDDEDLSDPAVVARIVTGLGLDGPALVAGAGEFKQALLDRTQQAVDRGVFGVPTFFVGDELFVGNDRLDFVEEELRRRR